MNADIKLSKIKEKWKKQCEQRMTSKSEHQKRKRNGKNSTKSNNIYIYLWKKTRIGKMNEGRRQKKNWRRNQ